MRRHTPPLTNLHRRRNGLVLIALGFGCKRPQTEQDGIATPDPGPEDPIVAISCPEDMVAVPGGVLQGQEIPHLCVDRTEVTARAYWRCVDAGACEQPAPFKWCNGWERASADTHPVNCVDSDHADVYCAWLGRRLPESLEWEWAARGRDQVRRYPWGEAAPTCTQAILQDESGLGCGANTTWPVGSRPAGASRDGVLDLVGNVEEWTNSWFEGARITRGGNWSEGEPGPSSRLEVMKEGYRLPWFSDSHIGFRCVLTAELPHSPRPSTTVNPAPPRCPEGMAYIAGGAFEGAVIDDFCLDITEVTVEAFGDRVEEKNHSAYWGQREPYRKLEWDVMCNARHTNRGRHPMNCVDWYQSVDYCESLGQRLPTEREWVWAARGRDEARAFPWGERSDGDCEFAVVKGGCGKGRTWRVGAKPAGVTRDGLHDMCGNVGEWLSNSTSDGRWRVIQGGNLVDGYTICGRYTGAPGDRHIETGFRCASAPLPLDPSPKRE